MPRGLFRVPSGRKRLAARTSAARYVRHNLGVKAPRGMGWVTNPKKAMYNRVYNRSSIGCATFGMGVLLLLSLLVVFSLVSCPASSGGSPSNLDSAIALFLEQHPEFGNPTSAEDLPDWAQGRRQRVRSPGRSLLFYLKNEEVQTVYEDVDGSRQLVWERTE